MVMEEMLLKLMHIKSFWSGAVVFNKAYSKCGAIFSQLLLNPVLKSSECFALEYSGKHDDWFTVLILYGLSVRS